MPIIIIGGTVLLSKYFFMPWYVTDIISYLRYSHYRRFCVILIHIFNYSYLFRNSFWKKGGPYCHNKKYAYWNFFWQIRTSDMNEMPGENFLYALQSSSTFSLNICYICYCCFDTPCVCRGVIYVLLSITHRYRQ